MNNHPCFKERHQLSIKEFEALTSICVKTISPLRGIPIVHSAAVADGKTAHFTIPPRRHARARHDRQPAILEARLQWPQRNGTAMFWSSRLVHSIEVSPRAHAATDVTLASPMFTRSPPRSVGEARYLRARDRPAWPCLSPTLALRGVARWEASVSHSFRWRCCRR